MDELFQKCVAQLRQWHAVGYIRSEQETREWLQGQGLKEPKISEILTAFGF